MKTGTTLLVIAAGMLGLQPLAAHTNYGTATRNLGPGTTAGTVADPITGFSSIAPYFKTISVSNIGTDFGWASGTLPEFGDAHHIRAFRFTLAEAGYATLRAESGTTGFFPGFTLYGGLLNLTGGSPYDGAALTVAYLDSIGQDTSVTYRALNSLGTVIMFNDAGNMSELTYLGNAADGTSANFGNASGILGDGSLDGIVERSFWLEAGDYTVFLGGANIHGMETGNQSASLSLTVIPEPSAMILIGVSTVGLVFRRRARTNG